MKDQFITITGMGHYYGMTPFKVGKKIKCTKEAENPYDSEAIKCELKHIGKVVDGLKEKGFKDMLIFESHRYENMDEENGETNI